MAIKYISDTYDIYDGTNVFDIDTPLYVVQTGMQKNTRPRLPRDTWFALKPDDQRAWDQITDQGKATIIAQHHPTSNRDIRTKPFISSSMKPPVRQAHQHELAHLNLDQMTPLQIFYAGRESGMKIYEAQQTEAADQADNFNNYAEECDDGDGEAETEDQDQVYALLTQSKEANTPSKPSKSIQTIEKASKTKPLPGNVNRLLSKSMSRS